MTICQILKQIASRVRTISRRYRPTPKKQQGPNHKIIMHTDGKYQAFCVNLPKILIKHTYEGK